MVKCSRAYLTSTDRGLQWNPVGEQITNDPEANAMLSRPYREPWVL